MSKEMLEDTKRLYDAVKDLRNPDEIERLAKDYNDKWRAKYQGWACALSDAKFYKLFNAYPVNDLVVGENAYVQTKSGGQQWTRHLAIKHIGLSPEEWDKRNNHTTVLDKLEHGTRIIPSDYLEVVGKLLMSENPHELAVGLIGATGRRPVEILQIGKFKKVPGEDYKLDFSGAAKKRGEKVTFQIDTLFPASYLIRRFKYLRNTQQCLQLKGLTESEVDSKRNKSLNRVVQKYFKDVIPARYNEDSGNNKALRAATACLVTERECKDEATGTKLKYASKFLGHFTDTDGVAGDKELRNVLTTLGYLDFYISGEDKVPYMPVPKEITEKEISWRAYSSDIEWLKQLKERWTEETGEELIQADVIQRVVKYAQLGMDVIDGNNRQNDTEATDTEDIPFTDGDETVGDTESVEVKKRRPNYIQPDLENYDHLTSEQLKSSRVPGSARAKVHKAIEAIKRYNDYVATSNNDRWAITIAAVRALTGTRHSAIKSYMDEYNQSIVDHHAKYDIDWVHNQNKGKKGLRITDDIQGW